MDIAFMVAAASVWVPVWVAFVTFVTSVTFVMARLYPSTQIAVGWLLQTDEMAADLILNAGYVALVGATMVRTVVWLRVILVGAACLFVIYGWIAGIALMNGGAHRRSQL